MRFLLAELVLVFLIVTRLRRRFGRRLPFAGPQGIPSRPLEIDLARDVIFKGATVQGINGRKMYETWFQMESLLASGKLNLEPVITHRLKLSEFAQAMEFLKSGEAIKVVFKME